MIGAVLGHEGRVVGAVAVYPGVLRVLSVHGGGGARRALGLLPDVARVAALLQPLLPETERAGAAPLQFGTPLAVELVLDLGQAVLAVVHLQARRQGLQVDDRPVLDVLPVEVDPVVLVDGLATGNCTNTQSNYITCVG